MQPRLFVVDRDSRYAEWLRRHLGALCPDAMVSVVDAAQFAQGIATISWDDCDLLLFVAAFGSTPEDPASEGLERLRQFRANPTFPLSSRSPMMATSSPPYVQSSWERSTIFPSAC